MIPSFGDRLRNLRLSRNLSQGKLAALLGISVPMIGLYENSSRMPSYEILIRMARFFKVTVDYLLGVEVSASPAFDLAGLTAQQAKAVFAVIEEFKKANENSSA